MIQQAKERLLNLVQDNRYLVLSTKHDESTWTAVLAYSVCGPRQIYFTSQSYSRHISDIQHDPNVSGVIFDSSETNPNRIDCVQFSGRASVVSDDELDSFLLRCHKFNSSIDPERKAQSVRNRYHVVLVVLDVTEAFVLDQEVYHTHHADARVAVDDFSFDSNHHEDERR
ncbi:pyridoxamine 5'-phosphate oxidase family protein [Candidatus Saccharibacteria bacterium]|nr:pyridoxamine 5'-phosphate oxidase family protein [Candidatus Saccharibacteria bacterium]